MEAIAFDEEGVGSILLSTPTEVTLIPFRGEANRPCVTVDKELFIQSIAESYLENIDEWAKFNVFEEEPIEYQKQVTRNKLKILDIVEKLINK